MSAWGGAFYACFRLGHLRQETAMATERNPSVMIPFLRKLITDKAETPIVEAATVVPVA